MIVKVFNSINDVREEEWNSILDKDDIFSSYKFIQAIEKSNFDGCKFWHLMIYDKEKLIASASFFSTIIDVSFLCPGILRNCIRTVRKIKKNFLNLHALICGLPVSLGKNNICIIEESDKKAVLDILKNKMIEIAQEEHIEILALKEFEEQKTKDFDFLLESGFVKVSSLATNKLNIKFDNFDDYIHSLRYNYRRSITRSLKKLRNNELKIEVHGNFEHLFNKEIYELYENVIENAQFRLEKLPMQFFINVNKYFKEDSQLILLKKNNKIIGMSLMMHSPNIAKSMFVGFDYKLNRENDIYFNLFIENVRQSIEKKKKVLDFGQTSYYVKARLGAEPKSLYVYVQHLNTFWNTIIKMFIPFLFPEEKHFSKDFFKKESVVKNNGINE